ncbi:MAG: TolC family protein [Planctomycetota bacterium]
MKRTVGLLRCRGALRIALVAGSLAIAGCMGNPFDTRDYLSLEALPEELHQIEGLRLDEQSVTPLQTVDEASRDIEEIEVKIPEPEEKVELTLAEIRAAALRNNLDLQVVLVDPSIASASVDREEAKFEAAFTASFRQINTDAAVALATEGSQSTFTQYEAGLRVPLRTGGTVNVALPFSKTETNNEFALLNPSYDAQLRFSLSQPLLRGAGTRVNTHSIRIAKYQEQFTSAGTKIDTILILSSAERAYWTLYATQRALEVRLQQYELAMDQLEDAKSRKAAGVVPEIEVIRARSGVAERLEGIIVAVNSIRRAQRELKRIMNDPELPIDSETGLILTTDPNPIGMEPDRTALAEYALANRMEMLQQQLLLAQNSSTIDFRRNLALPQLNVDYSYAINGLGDSYDAAFDQVGDKDFEDWSVGLSGEIPIGNEAAEADLHAALLNRIRQLASRDAQSLAIRQEVYDAIDQLRQAWLRILAARQSVLAAARTYEGEVRQFDNGVRTSTDVLDAAARLADAQLDEIRAITDYQISQIDIASATGTLLGYNAVEWEATEIPEDEYESGLLPGLGLR